VAVYHQWIAEMGYVDKSETNEKKLQHLDHSN